MLQKHQAHHAITHLRRARRGAELEQGTGAAIVTEIAHELAGALMMAGKPDQAELTFEAILTRQPSDAAARAGLERARGKLSMKGERIENGHPLLNQAKELERSGDYAGAWRAIVEGKEQLKARGYVYDADQATARIDRLRNWCSREKMRRLAGVHPLDMGDRIKPIFVLGYPRSGTTLLEQIISAHPEVTGGGELPFLTETAYAAPRLLSTVAPYPDALDELLLADTAIAATLLRTHYLARAAERFPSCNGYLTDKMPLNEQYLPLLHLIFPEAPKLLIRRDPLDVLISNYSLFLTHGSHQACDVQSCWHHIALIDDLTDHFRRKIPDLKLMVVQYENLVQAPELIVRAVAQFCGLTFAPAMLRPDTNPRYAHTASFSQVREPINSKGVGRWRHYEAQLRASLPQAFS